MHSSSGKQTKGGGGGESPLEGLGAPDRVRLDDTPFFETGNGSQTPWRQLWGLSCPTAVLSPGSAPSPVQENHAGALVKTPICF